MKVYGDLLNTHLNQVDVSSQIILGVLYATLKFTTFIIIF